MEMVKTSLAVRRANEEVFRSAAETAVQSKLKVLKYKFHLFATDVVALKKSL